MDHKTWLWRKKSNEKTIFLNGKNDDSLKGNGEQVQIPLADKAESDHDIDMLNGKLSSALDESNAKDDLLKKQAKMAQEAMAGREKASAEALSLKQELDEALQKRIAAEERSSHLDAALKECMQQLRFVRDEQEQRIHDAVTRTSKEFEASQIILEEKLANTTKNLTKLGAENTNLTKALLVKEKLIEDLSRTKTRVEADLNALMTRLNTTEKENASLKYEVRVLEKELEIRNEEREFNRRTADASHRQHLENIKKIAKLESECQRLRVLVRKRLPGPNALAKMKNEVEVLGREKSETRKSRSNSSPLGLMMDSAVDNSPDSPSRRINILTEHFRAMEEENKTLKEALNKKANELQFSRTLYTRAASKLSEVQSQLEESSKGQTIRQPSKNSVTSYEISLASMSDIGSDDKASCAESWASALVSEVEHFRNGKQRESPSKKTIGAAEINLMDDFVEMEKLATASVDKTFGNSLVSTSEADATVGALEIESSWKSSAVKHMEIVLPSNQQSDIDPVSKEIKTKDDMIAKYPGWLQDILKLIWEQKCLTQRNPHEILEDVRVVLPYLYNPEANESFNGPENSKHSDVSTLLHVSSATDINVPIPSKTSQQFDSDLSKPISKITELIEGIRLRSPGYGILETSSKNDRSILYKNSETPSGYMVRIFQWKTSELNGVLEKFVQACNDLLNKQANFNEFVEELSIALDWILNHCFSLQDVSSMRDAVKNHFDWDETRSESEAEVGMTGQFVEASRQHLPRDHLLGFPAAAAYSQHFQKQELQLNGIDEKKELKDELLDVGAAQEEAEGNIRSTIDKRGSLITQLQESEKIISNLQNELETMKNHKATIEDQVEDQKLANEAHDTQFSVQFNEAYNESSSPEVEPGNKNNCCNEMEALCHELHPRLESVRKKEIPSYELKQDQKQPGSGREITSASQKLAECQETILNLGKQLKALAAPKEAALFDKVISSPNDKSTTTAVTDAATPSPTEPKNKMVNQRSSLLDQMIAEDTVYPKTKVRDCNNSSSIAGEATEPPEKISALNGTDGSKRHDENAADKSVAIVPGNKKSGGSFWKKLLWRKKKSSSKKKTLSLAP